MKPGLLLLSKWFVFILVISLFVFSSVWDLYKDVVNPDGINWHTRSLNFVSALQQKKLGGTYQTYHPGITLMWVSGPVLNYYKTVIESTGQAAYSKQNFLNFDYYAKLSLIIFCTLLQIIIVLVLWKTVSFKFSMFFSIIFTLEPFVIGMRRLYHLDYLMTALIITSFVILIYYNYKSPKYWTLIPAAMFYALAILTKSTAVIVLPALPFMFLLNNHQQAYYKKIFGLLSFLVFIVVFIYAFFPALWLNPQRSFPKNYKRIVSGIVNIGYEGKKELGDSGKSTAIILDDTVDDLGSDFYYLSLFIRLSVAGITLLIISVSVFIYFATKCVVLGVWHMIKNKTIPKVFTYDPSAWLAFWSLGISLSVIIALSLSSKKTDRYEILVFPFLFLIIAYFLNKLDFRIGTVFIILYISAVVYEALPWHPYYLSYSNPYLGGIFTRVYTLDGTPFGIGTYESLQIVKSDRESIGQTGFYTIAGSKSLKAIADGAKFSRYPSCVTDYVVSYALVDKPTYTCFNFYKLVGTVKIGGFDYWYVYRRLYQGHQSNYE